MRLAALLALLLRCRGYNVTRRLGAADGVAFGAAAAGQAPPERPTSVAPIGASPKAIVLFTHLRRCGAPLGGTYLEDAVLKPHAKRLNLPEPLLCREGELARHHRLTEATLHKYRDLLSRTPLVWRHCPFGVHELLGNARPYVYVTMVRKPAQRMVSWFAYCDKYSKDKCHTGPFARAEPRLRKIPSDVFARNAGRSGMVAAACILLRAAGQLGTFHPNWLEYSLDDNYQTRMLCGGEAHDADVPLAPSAADCAVHNLKYQYAFVGLLERRDASLCVLKHMLGLEMRHDPNKDDKRGPTTHSDGAIENDFSESFASYFALDNAVYAEAGNVLDAHLERFPQCR